jgi:hypothetical protein
VHKGHFKNNKDNSMPIDYRNSPPHWSKDFVEQLRTVHFTLVAVSFGLIVLSTTHKTSLVEIAQQQLEDIDTISHVLPADPVEDICKKRRLAHRSSRSSNASTEVGLVKLDLEKKPYLVLDYKMSRDEFSHLGANNRKVNDAIVNGESLNVPDNCHVMVFKSFGDDSFAKEWYVKPGISSAFADHRVSSGDDAKTRTILQFSGIWDVLNADLRVPIVSCTSDRALLFWDPHSTPFARAKTAFFRSVPFHFQDVPQRPTQNLVIATNLSPHGNEGWLDFIFLNEGSTWLEAALRDGLREAKRSQIFSSEVFSTSTFGLGSDAGELSEVYENPLLVLPIPPQCEELISLQGYESLQTLLPEAARHRWKPGRFAHSFPELAQLTKDLEVGTIETWKVKLEEQRLRTGESFEAVGIKIPADAVTKWGIFLVLAVQLYFLCHLVELSRKLRSSDPGWEVAWIGMYQKPLGALVFSCSALLLPVVAVLVLGLSGLALSQGSDRLAGQMQLAICILGTAASAVLSLYTVRNRPRR